jgi:hypothetical protein
MILFDLAWLLGLGMIGMCLTSIIYSEADAMLLTKDCMPRLLHYQYISVVMDQCSQ